VGEPKGALSDEVHSVKQTIS